MVDWNLGKNISPAKFARSFVSLANLPPENEEKIRVQILSQLSEYAQRELEIQRQLKKMEREGEQRVNNDEPNPVPAIWRSISKPVIMGDISSNTMVDEGIKTIDEKRPSTPYSRRRLYANYVSHFPSQGVVKKACHNCGDINQVHGDNCRTCGIPFKIT